MMSEGKTVIFKILGSLCVMLSGAYIGNYMSQRQSIRKKQLLNMQKAFIFLKSQMAYSYEELSTAFENISQKTDKPINILFKNSSLRLEDKIDRLEEIWNEECEKFLKDSFLQKEDVQMLKLLGKTLGYPDVKHQIESIDFQIEYINKTVEMINQTEKKEEKLYRSLGILGSMLLVIILI